MRSAAQDLEVFMAQEPEPPNWGPWLLDPNVAVLWHRVYGYEIDLEQCLTSAQVLDWIMQVNGKTWPDHAATVTGLVEALDTLLHPQAFLCSFGKSGSLTAKAVVARVQQYAAGQRKRAEAPHVLVRPHVEVAPQRGGTDPTPA